MTRIWNRMRTGIAVILIILLMCGSVFGIWSAVDARKAYDVPALTEAELTDLDLSHAKRLMIVARGAPVGGRISCSLPDQRKQPNPCC